MLKNPFGRPYLIKNIGEGKIIIRAHSPAIKIDDLAEVTLTGMHEYVNLISDYNQWYIIDKG